jgi:hypothetical protein
LDILSVDSCELTRNPSDTLLLLDEQSETHGTVDRLVQPFLGLDADLAGE